MQPQIIFFIQVAIAKCDNYTCELVPALTRLFDQFRIPRIVADVNAARPIHLSIIDGIYTMTGGEGPWNRGVNPVHPGILIAGLNPVNTDAVGAAVMGFDPMAVRGTPPFERCDSTLQLAEQHGIGTTDLSRTEVIGTPISSVRFDYRANRARRTG